MNNTKKLPVIELFGPTIQGEGALAGRRSHFIRLGGCTFRCSWCDSMHAVDPIRVKEGAHRLLPEEIVTRLLKLDVSEWVTLSGGDPCMHNLTRLIGDLKSSGYLIAIETQGAFCPDWVADCDSITISPKPPSSGMVEKLDDSILAKYAIMHYKISGDMQIKVVCFNFGDLEFARDIHKKYPEIPFYISIGTPINTSDEKGKDIVLRRMKSIFDLALKHDDLKDVIVLPQLHYLAWGAELGK